MGPATAPVWRGFFPGILCGSCAWVTVGDTKQEALKIEGRSSRTIPQERTLLAKTLLYRRVLITGSALQRGISHESRDIPQGLLGVRIFLNLPGHCRRERSTPNT